MSKKLKQYIFFISFAILLCSNVSALETTVSFNCILIESDSLNVDTSTVKQRTFNDLKTLYTGEDYIYERAVENSGWWTRFKQWLSDLWRSLFNIDSNDEASKITDNLITIAAIIIILLVIYFIFKAIINKEGKWVFGKSSDKKIIPNSKKVK